MTPQELKNSILQLAIQGKLVEQRAEEGTGRELLEKILAAKSAKSAKVGSRVSHEEIPDDEKPFDIPESWEWARLGDIVIKDIKRGKSPTYTQKSGTLVFAQKCNTKAGVINLSLALFLDEAKLSKYPESEFMRDGDIVINSTGNGTLGRVGIYHDSDNPNKLPVVPDSHVTVVRVGEKASVEYVFYALKHYQPLLEKHCSGSTNQTELSASTVKSLLFPLPPLAEQKRIVAKIEELLPLVDRYEKAWSKLKDFNKRFPVDMQKSLLQMAIQGKLVEQRAEEGTGRELLEEILAAKNAEGAKGKGEKSHAKSAKSAKVWARVLREEISDDEKPFDIPKTWKWVRFGHIMINRDAERIPLSVDERSKLAKKYDYYGASGVIDKVDDFIFDKPLLLIGEDGANLLTRNTPIAFIARGKYWVNNHAHVLDCNSDLVHIEYVMWFINAINLAPYVTGTAQPKMNQQKMNSIPVALPPFAEQKRIVAKLEELLPLCERLK